MRMSGPLRLTQPSSPPSRAVTTALHPCGYARCFPAHLQSILALIRHCKLQNLVDAGVGEDQLSATPQDSHRSWRAGVLGCQGAGTEPSPLNTDLSHKHASCWLCIRAVHASHIELYTQGTLRLFCASQGKSTLPFALSELIDNAIRATQDNTQSRQIVITLALSGGSNPHTGLVSVWDNGEQRSSKREQSAASQATPSHNT